MNMIIYFVIGNLRGTFSSVNMLKGYMLTSRNAEGVHGQRKVGNPCARQYIYGNSTVMLERWKHLKLIDTIQFKFCFLFASKPHQENNLQTYINTKIMFLDIDECKLVKDICKQNTTCFNTLGSYICGKDTSHLVDNASHIGAGEESHARACFTSPATCLLQACANRPEKRLSTRKQNFRN